MEREVTQAIDRAIGYYMVDEKLTQEEMAKQLGITSNTLRWKREGKYDWSWGEILKLSKITGKTPDELAGIAQPV